MLDQIEPRVIVIGEAPSDEFSYYPSFHIVSQNSAGDILLECEEGKLNLFTSEVYSVDFLEDLGRYRRGYHYIGSLAL